MILPYTDEQDNDSEDEIFEDYLESSSWGTSKQGTIRDLGYFDSDFIDKEGDEW